MYNIHGVKYYKNKSNHFKQKDKIVRLIISKDKVLLYILTFNTIIITLKN